MNNENLKDYKVCIITSFYMYDNAYSLINCVEDQLRMFVNHDYKIKLVVDEKFPLNDAPDIWKHQNIVIERIPSFSKDNDGILPPDYQEQVNNVYNSLKEILSDCKIVLTHDLTLQPAELVYNLAARRLADDRSDLRWLHWCHSATAPSVRCSDEKARGIIQQRFPNSFMCYPNDADRKRVALNYGYELSDIKKVSHPSDFTSLMFGDEIDLNEIPDLSIEAKRILNKRINYPIKLSKDLVREFNILDADVISVYPARLDRGKQVEFNIKTMGAIKKLGRTVKMIIFDFHSTGGDKIIYREELKQIARKWGLTEQECIFISEWREETNLHVPREVIMNLKKISDFHMHPSTSETYSLVVQESMAWRNFCILNHHAFYMRDIYGSENVLYEPFGAAVNSLDAEDGSTNVNITNEELHFENLAKKVLYFIEKANPVLAQWRFIRQKRNLDYVFRNELEPLLYYEKLGEKV